MAEPPVTAPMEVDTTPEEDDDGLIECVQKTVFFRTMGFTATGTGKSNMLAVLSKMKDTASVRLYASLEGTRSKKADALWKLLDTDTALKRRILKHLREAIERWNKDCRAAADAAAGTVDDSPPSYPVVGEGLDVLRGTLQERKDLAAEARSRFGDGLDAQALGQRLLKSNAPEDKELIKKLLAHRKVRHDAWRETRSGDDGLKLRDFGGGTRTAVSATAQTPRAAPVNWSDAAGEKGTKALEEALAPLDATSPLSDTATWDAIAATVSAAARRTYTGEQCYGRAHNKGYLRAKPPDAEIYDPSMRDWRPRAMEELLRAAGLDQSIPCGKAALKADAFKGVSTTDLYCRLRDVYNLGTKLIYGDREKIIAALVEAGSCAVDPRDHGAKGFKGASSQGFNRDLIVEAGQRLNVLRALQASEACLESSSEATRRIGWDYLSRTNGAIYGRLVKQNTMHLCFQKLDLEPHEAPPTHVTPLLNEFFFRPLFTPHVEYDAAQDCTCCRGLYEDNGFATCLEHGHDVQFGCCAIRNNGACEFRSVAII